MGPNQGQPREVNLLQDEPGPSQSPAPLISAEGSEGKKTTIEDYTRVFLAGALVVILAILVVGAGAFVAVYPKNEPSLESFLKLVFTPIVGLVGSVVGFYFGSRGSSSPS